MKHEIAYYYPIIAVALFTIALVMLVGLVFNWFMPTEYNGPDAICYAWSDYCDCHPWACVNGSEGTP